MICEQDEQGNDEVRHYRLRQNKYPPCLLKFHICQSDTKATDRRRTHHCSTVSLSEPGQRQPVSLLECVPRPLPSPKYIWFCGPQQSECRFCFFITDESKDFVHFGLIVTVCHYPTGASKWNPIEHRLFSEISKTWAGCPLRTFTIAAQYIRETKTQTGLSVCAHLIQKKYATGEKISDEMLATLNIVYHEICPQWNYSIYPRGYRQ